MITGEGTETEMRLMERGWGSVIRSVQLSVSTFRFDSLLCVCLCLCVRAYAHLLTHM